MMVAGRRKKHARIKRLVEKGRYAEALQEIIAAAANTEDYSEHAVLSQYFDRVGAVEQQDAALALKVAILGGATTEFLLKPLQLELATVGLSAELYASGFNLYAQEMLSTTSGVSAFNPDVAVLALTPANVKEWPNAYESDAAVDNLVQSSCKYWLDLCAALHNRVGCEIVIDNFHMVPVRPSGNLGAKLAWDQNTFLGNLNAELGACAPGYLHINDVQYLSARYGISNWLDLRYWHHAKLPVAFGCLVPYVRSVAKIIGAIYGRSKKCAVLDLDNTLWGGVVGDDGVNGIIIGEGDPVGEAYKSFQQYLLDLKDRGVLLAVCSKNDEENALAPFERHPEMILKRDDFVAFKANWQAKPDNLAAIADELNIGLDSMVFLDDNPAEREHVRQRLPEVAIVELGDEPSDFPLLLDRSSYFETVAISTEDSIRSIQYFENTKRKRLQESAVDYESYLASLQQRAVIAPFEEQWLDRITQLINKTNQFNLTTKRLSKSDVESTTTDTSTLAIYARLRDCFGDNGLISVIIAHVNSDYLDIDLWLMSCRVLGRGVESLMCNYLVDAARERGIKKLRGLYVPSQRNEMVREHYHKLGFTQSKSETDGSIEWQLIIAEYEPAPVTIDIVEAEQYG